MAYRSVLVLVDSQRGSQARIDAAVRIAASNNALLTGVWLKSEHPPGFANEEGLIAPVLAGDAMLDESRQKIVTAENKIRQTFEAAAAKAQLRTSWVALDGERADELIAYARRYDLAILPRRTTPAFGDNVVTAEQVGMASGGPMLVLPESGFPPTFGRKILVAWKESREAARVLRDAWPFLRAAEEVHFLTALQDGEREMDALLQQQLELHGCPVASFRTDRDTGIPTSDIIRRHIDMVGADMAVLGLFGRSRFAEFVLGGVSRGLLGSSHTPLLFSH